MESLLVNVSKYASSHQTSPTENFITEAFAWLLKHDEAVRKAYVEVLASKVPQHKTEIIKLSLSSDVETQVNFGGKYPDLLWSSTDDDFCLIFEHKVWSELHNKQLSNYRKFAEEHLSKPFLIALVTGHSGQHRQSPDLAVCWYEIATLIENVSSNGTSTENWLRNEFVKLLKSNGLVNSTPLNPLAIAYYNEVQNIDKQLYEIVRRTVQRSWAICESNQTVNFNHPPIHRNARGRYDAFGRIGLEFSSVNRINDQSGWIPGVFCGFIINGDDHLVHDLLKSGPIAAMVLSVNKTLQSKLKSNGYYDLMVKELREKLPSDWELSDRTESGNKLNSWHPLVIYKKLSSFVEGTQNLDQQTEMFIKEMQALQKLLVESDTFGGFYREMHHLTSKG
ncbi:PD-(D/E)XK nuclease family protein [Vibrio splendidus]